MGVKLTTILHAILLAPNAEERLCVPRIVFKFLWIVVVLNCIGDSKALLGQVNFVFLRDVLHVGAQLRIVFRIQMAELDACKENDHTCDHESEEATDLSVDLAFSFDVKGW